MGAQSISIFDIYIPTVLLIIYTILLLKLLLHLQYCFLVQWTTQMVTILESRCPMIISMKPITTTLNSYNKIRQTQQVQHHQLHLFHLLHSYYYNANTSTILKIFRLLLSLRTDKAKLYSNDYRSNRNCSLTSTTINRR